MNTLRSKWPSVLWAVGFVAFLAPCAMPGFAMKYTFNISSVLMITFVSTICLYYVGLDLYRGPYDRKKKEAEEVEQTAREAQTEEDEKNFAIPLVMPDTHEPQPELAHYAPVAAKKSRSYFLDNVKGFLTVIVVIFHMVLCFGVGYGGEWVLQVGIFESQYNTFLIRFFIAPNQGYFMSCFFFISAYFVPRSFAKKGRAVFIKERAQRIFVGAMIATWVLGPLSFVLIFSVATDTDAPFIPYPGTTWFLWWLLLFNLWYAFTASTGQEEGAKLPLSRYFQKIPDFASRWLAGIIICGILQYAVNKYLFRGINFATMPTAMGALTCHLLAFYVGLLAGENQWFAQDKPKIREQIGMNVWLFRALVLLEYVNIGLQPWLNNAWPFYNNIAMSETGQNFVSYIFYGIWCVDMNLCVLEFFQSHVDYCNPFSQWLAREAYGAYIFQNITITTAIAIFVWTYNGDPPLEFERMSDRFVSSTPIPIPTLATAMIYNVLLWVQLTWVLAYICRKMPVLKHVL